MGELERILPGAGEEGELLETARLLVEIHSYREMGRRLLITQRTGLVE